MSATVGSTPGSILGTRVLRTEDPKFLTGGGSYIENLDIPGAAHVVYVYSTMPHARLGLVDVADARTMPGVVAVFTGEDIDLGPAPVPFARMVDAAFARPLVAGDTVRFVGELVAVVVAETRAAAVDAADAVIVDYEPLPAVVDAETALDSDVHLFPGIGTNVAVNAPFRHGGDVFEGCVVVVEQRIVNQRVAPCPLEVRAGAARWDDDGRLVQWSCSQGAHGTRNHLADAYGLDRERVRVIVPDVGGGFGAKSGTYPEEVLLGWLARRVGRPVRWVETRSESMVTLGHGRGQVQYARLGGTRDGKLLAYSLRVVQDIGAYPAGAAMLPFLTRMMATGVYAIERVDVELLSVVTNTTPVEAYRGAGRPEATAAIERMLDLYAAEVEIDPAELRRRNFLTPDVFPYTTPTKVTYDSGDYEGALDRALAAADYEGLRREQAERRARNDRLQLGIGLSSYVEITNGGGEEEYGSVEMQPDGRAIARTGTSPHGQGHYTVFAMLVSEATGIPIDRIEVTHGDTDDVPRGNGTGGSRSLQAGGPALYGAAEALVRNARELAAELLEANADDIVLDRVAGKFHVAGTPAISHTWSELAAAQVEAGSELRAEYDFHPPAGTFPFGSHVVAVEVDTETGAVALRSIIACDDAGRVMNPVIVDGQVHGGLAQGVAQALWEEFRYDDDGNPITANLADYAFPSAAELPMFTRVEMETPTPLNPLGVKGIGEAATIGSTPAVQNAVINALAPFGVTHVDMPLLPERVWEAVRGAE